MQIFEKLKDKKVVFITTKNLDYIRNTQEINLLQEQCEQLEIIGYADKGYAQRLCKVYGKILLTSFNRFDSVFIGFAPQLVLPFFNFKLKKKEVIIDFFISLYDTFVFDRKKIEAKSFIAKILYLLDKKTLELANKVVVDTKAHGKYFVDELQCGENKIQVLYLDADSQIYYPRKMCKKNYAIDKFVVLYFGSILPLQGIDVILGAIDLLKNDKTLFFYVIGPVKEENKPISDNIFYYEWLSQEELAEKISEADLCLAGHFAADIDKAKRTIPGKAYIYNAMQKEMILGDNVANHELFSEDRDAVYFVEMGNSNALAEKIMQIAAEKRKHE